MEIIKCTKFSSSLTMIENIKLWNDLCSFMLHPSVSSLSVGNLKYPKGVMVQCSTQTMLRFKFGSVMPIRVRKQLYYFVKRVAGYVPSLMMCALFILVEGKMKT